MMNRQLLFDIQSRKLIKICLLYQYFYTLARYYQSNPIQHPEKPETKLNPHLWGKSHYWDKLTSGKNPTPKPERTRKKAFPTPNSRQTRPYYFMARYYSNTLHRFLEIDPVTMKSGSVLDPQGWNLYVYCANNPINLIDPDGENFVAPVLDAMWSVINMAHRAMSGPTYKIVVTETQKSDAVNGKGTPIEPFQSFGPEQRAGVNPYPGGMYVPVVSQSLLATNAQIRGDFFGYCGHVTLGVAEMVNIFMLYRAAVNAVSARVVNNVSSKALSNVNSNTLNHIFGKPGHNLGNFLNKFGGNQIKAYDAIMLATQKQIAKNQISGVFQQVVRVKGFDITVRGNVIDKIVKIGTAFIP
jgi:RHS repeat-associated protein